MKKETSTSNMMNTDVEADNKVPALTMGRTVVRCIFSFAKKTRAWAQAKLNAHFDRLVSLRVYDQRRL